MVRLLRYPLLLIIFFAGLLVMLRGIGAMQRGNWFAAMLAEDAQLSERGWCWRGLCPDYTPYKTAFNDIQGWFPAHDTMAAGTILYWEQTEGAAHWSGRVRGIEDMPMQFAQIRPMLNSFTFGEAVLQFGEPSVVQIHGYIGYDTWLIFVYYERGIYTEMVIDEPRLKPNQAVISISFDATGETARPTDFYPRKNTIDGWHGFALLR
ncbi:MAG: hypothetical protein KF716_06195 [Anaerolineae bacterium]|nr:hypothetical protein [Anaerolineae bacterium]